MFQCPAPIVNIPVSPQNHEWLKVLASAGIGLFVGIVTEPLKSRVLWWSAVRRAEKLLATELYRNFTLLHLVCVGRETQEEFWSELRFEIYDYYYKNQDLFNASQRTISISSCLYLLKAARDRVLVGAITEEEGFGELDNVWRRMEGLQLTHDVLKRFNFRMPTVRKGPWDAAD